MMVGTEHARRTLVVALLGLIAAGGCKDKMLRNSRELTAREKSAMNKAIEKRDERRLKIGDLDTQVSAKPSPKDDLDIPDATMPAGISATFDDPLGDKLRRLESVGKKLAESAGADVKFQGDILTNPKPRIQHSQSGQIVVTSGLMDTLDSDEELAALIAREMTVWQLEKAAKPGRDGEPAQPDSAQVVARTEELLGKAGYARGMLAKVDTRYPIQRRGSAAQVESSADKLRKLQGTTLHAD
jgi:hypothetical protein